MTAHRLVKEMEQVDMGWRSLEKLNHVMQAVMIGYQVALYRALGEKGMKAMSQLLLTEVGDLIADVFERFAGEREYSHHIEDIEELVKEQLEHLGIARDVRVEELEKRVKYGQELRRFRKEVYDSVFTPVHRLLVERGLKEYPLSPEALLVAAIIRRALRSVDERARVKVDVKLPQSPREPLTILVEEITRLH